MSAAEDTAADLARQLVADEAELERLSALAARHIPAPIWRCMTCGALGPGSVAIVHAADCPGEPLTIAEGADLIDYNQTAQQLGLTGLDLPPRRW